jgi:predicted phosphoribosyltransferase
MTVRTVLPFRDRSEAGRRLAVALESYRQDDCLILALPRGGVPVAAAVADALGAPLDLLLVRKIGAPFQPELAIGAVVDGGSPIVVRNEEVIGASGTSERDFRSICARELAEIERRRREYLKGREPLDPRDRVAIVIDDGIATGATMRAALKAVRKRGPRKLVLAIPVAPAEALAELRDDADDIVCLATPEPFGAVGYFYEHFDQVSDAEVSALLIKDYRKVLNG